MMQLLQKIKQLNKRKWRPNDDNFLFDVSDTDMNEMDCIKLVKFFQDTFKTDTTFIKSVGRYEFYSYNDFYYIPQSMKYWIFDRNPYDISKFCKELKACLSSKVVLDNGFPSYRCNEIQKLPDGETLPTHVYIVYHNDHDGIFSGRIAYEHCLSKFKRVAGSDSTSFIAKRFTMIPIKDYSALFSDISVLKCIAPSDLIIFVDYSFSNDKNVEWLRDKYYNGYNIIWIDHHATSIKVQDKNKWMQDIDGLVNTTFSATKLAYLYFYSEPGQQCDFPIFIEYVDSYDTWKHHMPKTQEFHYGLGITSPFDPFFITYDWLSKDDFRGSNNKENKKLNDIINKGEIYLSVYDKEYEDACCDYGFPVDIKFNGVIYNAFALNSRGPSRMFKSIDNSYYDIMIPFYFNGKKFIYSLFTENPNINVGEMAEALGGGGHPKAAGFQSDTIVFKDNVLDIPS